MIDLLTLNLCQSFAHKVEEKNGRQLTLSVGCCRYMKGGEAMCRVASNCLRPDGSFGARYYEGDTKTDKIPKSFK